MLGISLLTLTNAQIDSYGIENLLEGEKVSFVRLTITFSKPVESFDFVVFARIRDFNSRTTAGNANCKVMVSEISRITCKPELTEEKKTLEISFKTEDFIKKLGDKYFFSGDFTLGQPIKNIFAYVKLPEGMGLSKNNSNIFPKNGIISSDGRRIVIIWRINEVKATEPIKFSVSYEPVKLVQTIETWKIIAIVSVVAISSSYLLIQKIRKPKEVILSVLDEYERKVMDVIVGHGGKVKQKRIVQETNLSKAKVSRVIKSLVDRGLIEVERLGRTNRIKLVKHKFGLF